MKGRLPAEPAPSRGCYDRALSRQARQAEQRERLVDWMAETYRERGERLTVQDVVERAGVGRNTFYEYFDGLEHGLAYASQTLAKRIYERTVSGLEVARTPIARLRVLSRVWVELASVEPASMALLVRRSSAGAGSESSSGSNTGAERGAEPQLRPGPERGAPERGALSEAGVLFRMLLTRALSEASVGAVRSEPSWELCVAFAAEGALVSVQRETAEPGEMQEALSLILQRVFR